MPTCPSDSFDRQRSDHGASPRTGVLRRVPRQTLHSGFRPEGKALSVTLPVETVTSRKPGEKGGDPGRFRAEGPRGSRTPALTACVTLPRCPTPAAGAGGWAQLPALPEAGVCSVCSESLTPMSHTLPFPSPRLAGLAKRSREVVFRKA